MPKVTTPAISYCTIKDFVLERALAAEAWGNQVRISAKSLGAVAMPTFCQRCFWVRLKSGNKLPYQTFPGIFSAIDGYTKDVVHAWFDAEGAAPTWLSDLGKVTGYIE